MAEIPPDSTPDSPQQSHAPDGWELACTGILRSEFGRRPSHALDNAMMQLSAEKAWLEVRTESVRATWWQRVRDALAARPGFVFAASVVALVLAVWIAIPHIENPFQSSGSPAVACKLSDALNVRWAGNASRLKIGDYLPGSVVRLESGVVELAFASGAKAAVEGPAEFKLIDRNSMELHQGKLAAEVPAQARGFSVQTPNARVVDLGTRFGLNTKSKDSSEVDVFEGKVRVTQGNAKQSDNQWDLTRNMAMVLDNRGGVTAAAEPETAFPQPGHSVLIRPANCGFDSPGFTKIGGFPSTFGFWSGPAFELTGAIEDVRPVQGTGMLRFFAPPPGQGSRDSVVWQLVDLRPAKQFMAANGTVDLKAWVQFNRIPGDSRTASKFKLSIAAFRGQPADAAALWAARNQSALAFAEKELDSDNDPKTWERVDLATTVSADADFAVMEIRAIAPAGIPAGANPFPGHFADLIDAKVCLPLRAGSAAAAR
jgi:hypothetical protein